MTVLTTTVLISALTSTLVGSISFIVGVRIAKDQGDRAAMRGVYQRLFEHFRGLRDAIAGHEPKTWGDFPKEGDRYVPLFRKMQETGEVHLLPASIVADCEIAEFDALVAGSKHRAWCADAYIPALRNVLTSWTLASSKFLAGKRFRPFRAGAITLLSQDELQHQVSSLLQEGLGLSIELSTERGRVDPLQIYPAGPSDKDAAQALQEAWELAREDPAAKEHRAALVSAKADLDRLLVTLGARVRDPHPLLESVVRSFKDALRVR